MSRDSTRFGDAFLEKFVEWVEQNIKPELVYLDDEPLHNWARRNGYSRPLVTIKHNDGLHFIWPKGRDVLRKRLGAADGLAAAAKSCLVWSSNTYWDGEVGIPAFVFKAKEALTAWRAADGG